MKNPKQLLVCIFLCTHQTSLFFAASHIQRNKAGALHRMGKHVTDAYENIARLLHMPGHINKPSPPDIKAAYDDLDQHFITLNNGAIVSRYMIFIFESILRASKIPTDDMKHWCQRHYLNQKLQKPLKTYMASFEGVQDPLNKFTLATLIVDTAAILEAIARKKPR